MRRFAELGKEAPLVWVVPLANIDGVEQGDYGKDNFPYDLNRAWGNPPMRHETLLFQQDLRRWSKRCHPGLATDFHAPGASETAGIYAFLHAARKLPQTSVNSTNWANTLADSLGEQFIAKNFIRSGDFASRWNSPRFGDFCQEELGVPALALEIPYAIIREMTMTREQYREAGKRIADAVVRRLQAR